MSDITLVRLEFVLLIFTIRLEQEKYKINKYELEL